MFYKFPWFWGQTAEMCVAYSVLPVCGKYNIWSYRLGLHTETCWLSFYTNAIYAQHIHHTASLLILLNHHHGCLHMILKTCLYKQYFCHVEDSRPCPSLIDTSWLTPSSNITTCVIAMDKVTIGGLDMYGVLDCNIAPASWSWPYIISLLSCYEFSSSWQHLLYWIWCNDWQCIQIQMCHTCICLTGNVYRSIQMCHACICLTGNVYRYKCVILLPWNFFHYFHQIRLYIW